MIQTVNGRVSKADYGAVLMHEHVSCSSLSFGNAFGERWLDKARLAALAGETLRQMQQQHRLGIFVDGTPIDLGRDALLLKEVSELSGVKIVASTGFYYLESIEALNNPAEELAALLIDECRRGINGTDVKPGILKCATGSAGITEDNRKKLSTMATVQKETGLPLYVHCEHREEIVQEQIDLLLDCGADAKKLLIGHTAIRPDAAYLEEILKSGCSICMDQCHCYPKHLHDIAAALATLCQKGYTSQIMLSNDYCIHSDFCKRHQNGMHLTAEQHAEKLGYIFDPLYEAYLSLGGIRQDWETMLCKNPIDILDVE